MLCAFLISLSNSATKHLIDFLSDAHVFIIFQQLFLIFKGFYLVFSLFHPLFILAFGFTFLDCDPAGDLLLQNAAQESPGNSLSKLSTW